MGMRANAHLIYGFAIEDSIELDEEDTPAFVVWVGVDGNEPYRFISLESFRTDWESYYVLPVPLVAVNQADVEEVKEYCEKHGIQWEDPSWILAASFG